MIRLGSTVRDVYSKFEGIAIARTEWLYGCSRILIEPEALHDGKPIENVWFDEQRVEVIKDAGPVVIERAVAVDSGTGVPGTGGPQSDPSQRPDQ